MPTKGWTTEKSLMAQLQKMWDKGVLLQEIVAPSELFPLRLKLNAPKSKELSDNYEAVRIWVKQIQQLEGYRIVLKAVRHRIIGENQLPNEIWIDTLSDAILLLKKQKQVQQFRAQLEFTQSHQAQLIQWVSKHPHKFLELNGQWQRLLDFVVWRIQNPNPNIYLRQVCIPGIDSKFIEQHRAVISQLLDVVLPASQIMSGFSGIKCFTQRYGFLNKPERIRFRMLDSNLNLLSTSSKNTNQDMTLTSKDFQDLSNNKEWAIKVQRIFITENEINFLTFPEQPNSLIIFGAGYGFDALIQAEWLKKQEIYYWGDIDSHGFAILDQLRHSFPGTNSFLMNEETFLKYRDYWEIEPKQTYNVLTTLIEDEQALLHILAMVNTDSGRT